MAITIGSYQVGDGCPTFVVAEMAWAHDGSVDKAGTIVEGAARAGASAINFHLTSMKDYMVPDYGTGRGRVSAGKETRPVFDYLQSINLSQSDWLKLSAQAHDRGLLVSAMCNDFASLDFAASRLHPDMLMIHPSAIGEEAFVRAVAGVQKPVVLYIGGLWLGEVERAIRWAKEAGNEQLILQHGFQSYPTAPADLNLRFISTLKRLFGLPVAFGDHTDGGSEMALVVPLLAAGMGANVIEKHITYDRSARGEDFESALDPADFKVMVERLRQAEAALGSSAWRPLSPRELDYRGVVRKRAVASRALPRDTIITLEDIAFKRSDAGLYPEDVHILIGRKTIKKLDENSPVTWDVVA